MIADIRPTILVIVCGALGACLGCDAFVLPTPPPDPDNPTQFAEAEDCGSSLYDAQFDYGFDLPETAQYVRSDLDQNALTNTLWTVAIDGTPINILTSVRMYEVDVSLGELVRLTNDSLLAAGADAISEEPIVLASGHDAIQSLVTYSGLTLFRVQAVDDGLLFGVEAVVEESARTSKLDATLSGIVGSLCIN